MLRILPPSRFPGQVNAAGAVEGGAERNLNNNKGKEKKKQRERGKKKKKPPQPSRRTEVIRGTEQIIGEANNAF